VTWDVKCNIAILLRIMYIMLNHGTSFTVARVSPQVSRLDVIGTVPSILRLTCPLVELE